jgi:acetyl-CoA synthetase
MTDAVWTPSPDFVERANVTRLMRRNGVSDYAELLRRSQEEPEWFWPAAIEDMGIRFSEPWQRVYDDSRGPEWTTWFTGGRLNIARICVHEHARGPLASAAAAVFAGEDGERRSLTFAELSHEVTRFAEALAALGVAPGDRVGLYLPMSPEAAIASYACAHLGAIMVPIFSGFAAPAVAERLADGEVKVVVTADGSLRRGRTIPMKEIVDEAAAAAPSLEHVVVWSRLGRDDVPMQAGRDVDWADAVDGQPGTLEPLEVESETPFLLIYTSGTTGKPKGVVHVQGGFVVSIGREVCYQADARPGDVILYVSDLGWVMGPWSLVGGHVNGATVVLPEGAPDWPPDRLWELVERERVTILGVSPTLVRALAIHGDELVRRHDLSTLRIFVTSGEPWNPEPYLWLYDVVGEGRVPIVNCSGGTEVGACFLASSPVLPIKTCSVGGPSLGMDVDVADDDGNPVRGRLGELVCRRPSPGMTRGFWRDPERYLEAYWQRLPGIWVHGDWASIDEDGAWFLHGRSDDTLNIAGKRLGPAELESAAVGDPNVAEAAAIAVPHDVKGEVAWLACVLVPGAEASEALASEVADRVAASIGKAFRPERVVFVPALPKTRSAKIVRRAVRASALGTDPGDLSSLENPESLPALAEALRR